MRNNRSEISVGLYQNWLTNTADYLTEHFGLLLCMDLLPYFQLKKLPIYHINSLIIYCENNILKSNATTIIS